MTNRSLAIGCILALGLTVSACQTPQARQDELARLCADPANRAPGSFSWGECQSLYPSTDQQLQQNFLTGAPSAR